MVPHIVDGALKGVMPNPSRDALDGFAPSLLVLVVILLVSKFGKGFVANISVLIGIVVGSGRAATGKMNFEAVARPHFRLRDAVPLRPADIFRSVHPRPWSS